MHIHNIYIARSNLVSLSSLDAHLMGQVRVRNEYFFSMVVLCLAPYTSPFFFLRQGMNVVHPFLSFQEGVALFCNHISWIRVDGRVRE